MKLKNNTKHIMMSEDITKIIYLKIRIYDKPH